VILTVDRIEGEWVVLETNDGITFDAPAEALPEGIGEGEQVVILRVQ
jgi:hypothetical protein